MLDTVDVLEARTRRLRGSSSGATTPRHAGSPDKRRDTWWLAERMPHGKGDTESHEGRRPSRSWRQSHGGTERTAKRGALRASGTQRQLSASSGRRDKRTDEHGCAAAVCRVLTILYVAPVYVEGLLPQIYSMSRNACASRDATGLVLAGLRCRFESRTADGVAGLGKPRCRETCT